MMPYFHQTSTQPHRCFHVFLLMYMCAHTSGFINISLLLLLLHMKSRQLALLLQALATLHMPVPVCQRLGKAALNRLDDQKQEMTGVVGRDMFPSSVTNKCC